MNRLNKIFIVIIVVAFGTVIFAAGCSGNADSGSNSSVNGSQYNVSQNGEIEIDTSTVTSTATFYDATINGLTVEIFAVLASDNTVRVAFNTCQVCNGSKKAYFVQSGNYMVCQNCKSKISIDTVGKSSNSCNPVPVKTYSLNNGIITVSQTYLEGYVSLFKNWKDN